MVLAVEFADLFAAAHNSDNLADSGLVEMCFDIHIVVEDHAEDSWDCMAVGYRVDLGRCLG